MTNPTSLPCSTIGTAAPATPLFVSYPVHPTIFPIPSHPTPTQTRPIHFSTLSDSELYQACKRASSKIYQGQREFERYLSEVFRRRLYRRRGCGSIYEFAGKMAGMSREKVDTILRLSKKVEDKPHLRTLLELGKAGYSKIKKVAYVATPETEEMWAEKVMTLTQLSLEAYVQNFRFKSGLKPTFEPEKMTSGTTSKEGIENFLNIDNLPGISGDGPTSESEKGEKWVRLSFPVNPTVELKLRQLKQRLEQEWGETVTFNEVLEKLFEMAKGGTEAEAREAAKTEGEVIEDGVATGSEANRNQNPKNSEKSFKIQLCPDCIQQRERERSANHEVTRHIPMAVQRLVLTRQEKRCAFPNCVRPSEIFHHTMRFALKKSHDPAFIVGLCKAHEGLLQAGLIENEENAPAKWRLRDKAPWWDMKNVVDDKIAVFRGRGKQ